MSSENEGSGGGERDLARNSRRKIEKDEERE
jgi:hypothetical protein